MEGGRSSHGSRSLSISKINAMRRKNCYLLPLLGAAASDASAPAAVAPPYAIITQEVTKNNFDTGVRGMHPLGCFPLWGREGVTLVRCGKFGELLSLALQNAQ